MGKKSKKKQAKGLKKMGGKKKAIQRPGGNQRPAEHKKAEDRKTKPIHYKPKTMEQFQQSFKIQTNEIKNKMKRIQVHEKRKGIKNSIKLKDRKLRKKLPKQERQQPITIEDKQLGEEQFVEEYSEQCLDQFNKYLNKQAPIKILITTCLKPHVKVYGFIKQLMMVLHNVAYYPRRDMKLQDVYQYARDLKFSHVVVVRFTHGWQLLIRCLSGPLAIFRVTSVQHQKQIYHHALATDHYPELILNNFDSRVGVRVGRLLASMFPQEPQFKGRRVVTFHNQRDFIFFRHHRYIFRQGFDGVDMQEIGPRFTMRLLKYYAGDSQKIIGLQFQAKDNMYVDRKAVYL